MSNLAATPGRERFFLMHKKLLDFDTAYIFFGTVFLNARRPCILYTVSRSCICGRIEENRWQFESTGD